MKKGIFAAVAVAVAMTVSAGSASAGDVTKGKKVFKKCKACHDVGTKKKTGPGLKGIVGRKAATVEGYKYSKAMKASGLTWDEATLDKFLTKPKKMVKKTKMSFPGLKKPAQRADVIAYLATLK